MTDVEAKTPTKRKSFSNPQNKKGSGKKAKLDNVKAPQKNVSPKQNINKKNKKNSGSENDSSKKLKPFPGTQALGKKNQKKDKQIEKKGGTEGGEKKKKRRSQFYTLGLKIKSDDKQDAIQSIENKLKLIQSRKELTKTAKRKIKLLQRLKKIAEGQPLEQKQQNKPDSAKSPEKKNAKKVAANTSLQNKESEKSAQQADVKTNGKAIKNAKLQNKKAAKKVIPEKQVEEEEEDSDDDTEDDSDEAEQDLEEEDAESDDENDEDSGEEEAEGESDEEEEDDDEEESDEEEEDNPPPPKGKGSKSSKDGFTINKGSNDKKEPNKQNGVDLEKLKKNDLVVKNQKRFVLFVGNIPYDTNKLDLIEHFKKSAEIKHIRIPTEKKTSKPRGFAYLELSNEESYQKCLSMHHTFLKGRRINVLYTQGGKKKGDDKKKEIKEKNYKLHAMRKQGKLAGSKKQNQKRSFRRAKRNAIEGSNEKQQE